MCPLSGQRTQGALRPPLVPPPLPQHQPGPQKQAQQWEASLQSTGDGRDPVLQQALAQAVVAAPSGPAAGKPNPPCAGALQASRLPQTAWSVSTAIRLPQLEALGARVQPWAAAPPADTCAGAQGAAAAAPPARAARGTPVTSSLRSSTQMRCQGGRRCGGGAGAPQHAGAPRTHSPSARHRLFCRLLQSSWTRPSGAGRLQAPGEGGGGWPGCWGGGPAACKPCRPLARPSDSRIEAVSRAPARAACEDIAAGGGSPARVLEAGSRSE